LFYYTPSPQAEKKALRAVSRRAGCALLAVCALQLGVSFAAVWLQERLGLGGGAWFHLVAVLSALTVLAGALVGRELLRKRDFDGGRPAWGLKYDREGSIFPARLSVRPYWECVPLIPAGAALCMAGNLVGALVEQLAGQAGIEFQGGPEPTAPQGLPGLLLMLLTVAVLPAVTEEWLLRGVILPALRRFGDGFAVVCTAVLFALLHQNMEQAPMAFVSGLALGWVYIRSGRLAVPVAVHLWNNAAAVLVMFLPERAENVYVLGLAMLGVLSLFVLYLRRPKDNKGGRPAPHKIMCGMSAGKRAGNFFFGSVAMVLALVYFIAVIALNTRIA